MTHQAIPRLAPGTLLRADGRTFTVLFPRRERVWDGRLVDATFLVEDDDGARLLLRIHDLGAFALPGAFVATAWGDEPAPDPRHHGYRHSHSDWRSLNPDHEVFVVPRTHGHFEEHALAPGSPPRSFIAFDALEGATLRTLLRASARRSLALGPGFALALGVTLAEALAWLHAPVANPEEPRPRWHGRLDAQHVFVATAGRCRLLTPSLCMLHAYSVGMVGLGYLPHYDDPMSSTALSRPPWATGAAGDLWRLGLLLGETATGRAPCSEPAPRSTPELDACVSRLLSPDPARRFGSAGEAAAALRRARDGFGGPCDGAALAAVVAVLGAGDDGALAFAGDGGDGTCAPVILYVTETS